MNVFQIKEETQKTLKQMDDDSNDNSISDNDENVYTFQKNVRS